MTMNQSTCGINGVGDITVIKPGLVKMPTPTNAKLPRIVHPAKLSGVGVTDNSITPQSLNARLPSIVNSNPVDFTPDCGAFTQLIADNPLIAAAALGVLAFILLKHHKR